RPFDQQCGHRLHEPFAAHSSLDRERRPRYQRRRDVSLLPRGGQAHEAGRIRPHRQCHHGGGAAQAGGGGDLRRLQGGRRIADGGPRPGTGRLRHHCERRRTRAHRNGSDPLRAAGQDRSPPVSPGDPAPGDLRGRGQRDRLLSPKGKRVRDRADPVPGRRLMRESQRPWYTVGSPVVLIGLVAVAIATLGSLFDGSFVQNDSAQYVSMAENLRAGHGVTTSLVWTEEHLRLGSLPVAQTNLPPGYPILIALVGLLGVDFLSAAFLVSLACFSAIPFLIYRILRTTG